MPDWDSIADALEGRDLRRLREQAGLSLKEAARRMSMSLLTLSRYEGGAVPITSEVRARAEKVYREQGGSNKL